MPSISATGVRLRRSVQSPTAQTPGALVRLRSSTATAPPLSSTPASSSPRSATSGTRPTANMHSQASTTTASPPPARDPPRAARVRQRTCTRRRRQRQRRLLQPEIRHERHASDSEHALAGVDNDSVASPLLQLHPDAASRRAPFQAQRAGLGVQVDPTLREVLRDALPQLAVEAPQRQVPAVDQVHLRTESGENPRELHCNVACPYDDDLFRKLFQHEGLVGGDGQLLAGDLEAGRPAAGCNENILRPQHSRGPIASRAADGCDLY